MKSDPDSDGEQVLWFVILDVLLLLCVTFLLIWYVLDVDIIQRGCKWFG